MSKLNFVRAYATYCKYCNLCDVKPQTIQEFAIDFKINEACDHEYCNYDYRDPEIAAYVARA